MRHTGWYWILMVALGMFVGCGERGMDSLVDPLDQSMAGGMAKLVLSIPQDIQPMVRSVEYEITGTGISEPVEGTMSIMDDEARATVMNIPAGRNREFTVNVYGDKSIMTFSGSSETDVVSGETVQVLVNLVRLKGNIPFTARASSNATHAQITVSATDIPEPISQTFRRGDYMHFSRTVEGVPTGPDRLVTFKAYDTSPDKITDMGTAIVDVRHTSNARVEFELSSSAGSAEIIGRFPGQ